MIFYDNKTTVSHFSNSQLNFKIKNFDLIFQKNEVMMSVNNIKDVIITH